MSDRVRDVLAVTAPGLEAVCAAEARSIGMDAVPVAGGVEWRGDRRTVQRANLELRTASRIIVRAGEFRARGFAELERHAARLPWPDFLQPSSLVSLRVTSRKSKLYHEGAIAERIARVLETAVGAKHVTADTSIPASLDDDDNVPAPNAQLIIVRFLRDECTISLDSSGALLHQRGYRQAVARAPLRETIAAAMVLASGWRGDTPLMDPFCGSGTIPIEAALIARRIAPGIARPDLAARAFAFEQWPSHDSDTWHAVIDAARRNVVPECTTIIGSDRDAGAITAAIANAERAGVDHNIAFEHLAMSSMRVPAAVGHIVTNPPYGTRVGDRQSLRRLYSAFGDTVRQRTPQWTIAMLTADQTHAAATGLSFIERFSTRNGGIPVRLLVPGLQSDAG